MRKVVFLVPNYASKPVGGVKVVLEYANRLGRDGYEVKIVYAMFNKWWKQDLLHRICFFFQFCKQRITGSYLPRWFEVNNKVKQCLVWRLDRYSYPKDALMVGTAVDTMYYLNQFDIPASQKCYFIQDYEDWNVGAVQVNKTYTYEAKKIVISTWLSQIVYKYDRNVKIVFNGFDLSYFILSNNIEKRKSDIVCCMYSLFYRKAFDIASAVLNKVHQTHPNLKVLLFGTAERPTDLPSWYTYYQSPDRDTLNHIYNEASIYVAASRQEGWGLTIGEAMACGCAVACTDNKGYLEMAKDGQTALVSPVDDIEALSDNVIKLLSNDSLRCEIAHNGHQFIQSLDIEKQYTKFRDILFEGV